MNSRDFAPIDFILRVRQTTAFMKCYVSSAHKFPTARVAAYQRAGQSKPSYEGRRTRMSTWQAQTHVYFQDNEAHGFPVTALRSCPESIDGFELGRPAESSGLGSTDLALRAFTEAAILPASRRKVRTEPADVVRTLERTTLRNSGVSSTGNQFRL